MSERERERGGLEKHINIELKWLKRETCVWEREEREREWGL